MSNDTATIDRDRELHNLLADANARVTHAYHLPTVLVDGDLDTDIAEWLGEFASECLGWDFDAHDLDPYDPSEVEAFLIDSGNVYGWVVGVATPVASRFSEDGRSFMFSWGHSRISAVRGATYEDALTAAVEWAGRMRELDIVRDRESREVGR